MALDPVGTALTASGTATSPGAGSNILSLAAPVAGTYTIRLRYSIAGTAETAPLNVRLQRNGAAYADLPSLPGIYGEYVWDQVELDGTNAVQVRAVAAAVVGAIYTCSLVVQLLG